MNSKEMQANLDEDVHLSFGLLGEDQVAAHRVAPQSLGDVRGDLQQTGNCSVPIV